MKYLPQYMKTRQFLAAIVCFLLTSSALPLLSPSSAAEPASPPPLARFFPSENLVLYGEFGGLDAHSVLWQKTAACKLLNETSTGAMLEAVLLHLASRMGVQNPSQPLAVDDMRLLFKHAARSGFAFGVVRKPNEPKPVLAGLVLRGAAHGKVNEIFDRLIASGRLDNAKPQILDKAKGRKLNIEGALRPQGFSWWREGEDLAFSLANTEGADLMIESIDGARPSASAHPQRTALARVDAGFTPVGLAFVDAPAIADLFPQAAAFGLDKIQRLEYRWGFQDTALRTITRVIAPAPRAGLLTLFDQPTFDRKGLPTLPPGLTGFTSFSVDLASIYDRISAGYAASDPPTRAAFEAFESLVRDVTGYRVRDDILPLLGPRITFYDVPIPGRVPSNPLVGFAQGLLHTPEAALVIEVKDPKALAAVLDTSLAKIQAYFLARVEAPKPPIVRIHRLKDFPHGYSLAISPAAVPLPAGSRPTILLGKNRLIIGSSSASLTALSLDDGAAPLPAKDALAEAVGRLPDGMFFVSVNDPRLSLLPELIANLPGLTQWATAANLRSLLFPFLGFGQAQMMMANGGMVRMMQPGGMMPPGGPGMQGGPRLELDPDLLPSPDDIRPFLFPSMFSFTSDQDGFQFDSREAFPAFNPVALAPVAAAMIFPAVQSARAAARRSQSVNNLKQIGLALHNHHSANNALPPQAIKDKDGKSLLSWRVAILPYIEQQALYNEFKLDEPWDSEHNKPLIARMPATFSMPGTNAEPGQTFYRGVSGEHTAFDSTVKEGVGFQLVTDGTSNTIAVVEAKKAVNWTQPDQEFPFDAAAPPEKAKDLLPALGGHFPGGFNVLMLDGSVRFLKETINPQVLRALMTRDGGEVISADAY